MSEQSIREHHIGEPWLGMLSTILTEAGLGSEVQAFLYSKDVIGAPGLGRGGNYQGQRSKDTDSLTRRGRYLEPWRLHPHEETKSFVLRNNCCSNQKEHHFVHAGT